MKRAAALGLASAMMVSLLAGCGGTSGKDSTVAESGKESSQVQASKETSGDSSESGNLESGAEDGKKAYIDYDEDPYEVVIELLNLGMNQDSVPEMEAAINEITLPEINCTVKLQVIHIADHATKTALWAAGGEKIDIYYVGTTVPFSQFVSDGMIIPITDVLEERGQTILEKSGDLMKAFTVDGEIYAIPQNLYCATASGIDYNGDMFDELDMELPQEWNMQTLTDIGYKLKEVNPDYYLMAKNGATDATEMSIFYGMDNFGSGTGVYGTLMNPETDTQIQNMYTTEEFKEYCLYNIEWKENGFMPADQAVSGENAQDLYRNGQTFCQWVGVTPLEAITKQGSMSFHNQQAAFTNPRLTSSGVQEKAWGISMNCERPDKAMDFLNLLYENADLANILNYGIEGKDYVYTEGSDRIISYPEGVDGTNVGWARIFCIFGDSMDTAQMLPATEEFYSDLKAFNDKAVVCPTLGYTFDASNVATEITAVTNVVQEYVPSLVYGEVSEDELDAYLADLNERLDKAGINDIIAENQAQLDAWLASK